MGDFSRATETFANHAEEKRGWRNAFDLHLHGAGQAMLHGNATGRMGIDGKFDANSLVAHFAANVSDRGADAAIFDPGKSVQP